MFSFIIFFLKLVLMSFHKTAKLLIINEILFFFASQVLVILCDRKRNCFVSVFPVACTQHNCPLRKQNRHTISLSPPSIATRLGHQFVNSLPLRFIFLKKSWSHPISSLPPTFDHPSFFFRVYPILPNSSVLSLAIFHSASPSSSPGWFIEIFCEVLLLIPPSSWLVFAVTKIPHHRRTLLLLPPPPPSSSFFCVFTLQKLLLIFLLFLCFKNISIFFVPLIPPTNKIGGGGTRFLSSDFDFQKLTIKKLFSEIIIFGHFRFSLISSSFLFSSSLNFVGFLFPYFLWRCWSWRSGCATPFCLIVFSALQMAQQFNGVCLSSQESSPTLG